MHFPMGPFRSVVVTMTLAAAILLTACNKEQSVTPSTAGTSAAPVASAPPPKAAPTKPVSCPPAGAVCGASTCSEGITLASTAIPAEDCPFHAAQAGVDIFSWNEFIALNWPAVSSNCSADQKRSILDVRSGDGTTVVWQTYMPSDKVFVDPAKGKPASWCSGNGLLTANGVREFHHIAKAEPVAAKLGGVFLAIASPGHDVLQARGGIVTDQGLGDGKGGRWLRYEKLMNEMELKAIVDGNWWNKAGLKDKTVTLPVNAIEIKSAWKILTPTEKAGNRYFTTEAVVYNTPDATEPIPGKVTLGLVGLHIVQKTPTQASMLWSTFEHVDDDKVFFDPKSNAVPNTQLAKEPFIELNPDGTPHTPSTQIKRTHPDAGADELNAYYQKLLGNSVFANYRLISTQWGTGTASLKGTPSYVSNIAMETYVQDFEKPVKPDSEIKATGCFACHLNSKTSIGTSGDHSFFFLEAK